MIEGIITQSGERRIDITTTLPVNTLHYPVGRRVVVMVDEPVLPLPASAREPVQPQGDTYSPRVGWGSVAFIGLLCVAVASIIATVAVLYP